MTEQIQILEFALLCSVEAAALKMCNQALNPLHRHHMEYIFKTFIELEKSSHL